MTPSLTVRVLPLLALLALTAQPLSTKAQVSTTTANAKAPAEPQLAQHFALDLDRQATYYTFAVPQQIYAASQRDDLGDIRVFNGTHERVPYSLEAPREAERPPPLVERAVKWFPVPVRANGTTPPDGPLGLTIAPDGSLRLSPARTQRPSERTGERTTDIVDTGSSSATLATLVVHLSGRFQGSVTIHASDDLRSWRYVDKTSLLRFIVGSETLSQERIPLGHLQARYLRLNWPDGAPAIASMVVEEAGTLPVRAAPQRQWRDFDTRQGELPGDYFFTTDGAYPLDLLRLELPQTNTVARLTVSSRQNEYAAWQNRGQAVVYRLQSKGSEKGSDKEGDKTTEQVSPPLAVTRSTDHEWRINVDMQGGGLGAGTLKVSGGWHPQVLTFIARGEPPFTLAVGNPTLWSQAVSRADLMISADSNLAEAHLGAIVATPPSVADEPPPPEPDNDASRRIILWVALTLAVGVLGAIAWTLARLPSPSSES